MKKTKLSDKRYCYENVVMKDKLMRRLWWWFKEHELI